MLLVSLWGDDNGPIMQGLHLMYGVGALTGPLLAKPFLHKRLDTNIVMLSTNLTSHEQQGSQLWICYSVSSGIAWLAVILHFWIYLSSSNRKFLIVKSTSTALPQEGKNDSKLFRTTVGVLTFCFVLSMKLFHWDVQTIWQHIVLFLWDGQNMKQHYLLHYIT